MNSSLIPNNTQGSICFNDVTDKSIKDQDIDEEGLNKVL